MATEVQSNINHNHHHNHQQLEPHVAKQLPPRHPDPAAATVTADEIPNHQPTFTPASEASLVLLCLDYLRDVRRSYPARVLQQQEGLHADYLTVACWALNRAFDIPTLAANQNDCFAGIGVPISSWNQTGAVPFPSLKEMEQELLQQQQPDYEPYDQKKAEDQPDDFPSYEYDDSHPSNGHRFYPSQGLASGPNLVGPLTLPELTAAATVTLQAATRLQAEQGFIESPLFDQFVQAVQDKGFFDIAPGTVDSEDEREAIYEDRFRKVVAKFRVKLATKAGQERSAEWNRAAAAAEQQRWQRQERLQQIWWADAQPERALTEVGTDVGSNVLTEVSAASYLKRTAFSQKLFGDSNAHNQSNGVGNHNDDPRSAVSISTTAANNPADLEVAERRKNQGNAHMQKKEYQEAADCYTSALKLSPAGPQSHVYFSNRAAALVSMRRFHEAILDSERALSLKPDYGKAHARLGLAYFLLGNYRQAMEAYTVALKYEPDNKSSQSYLEKAAQRLAESGEGAEPPKSAYHQPIDAASPQMSFSVVSELTKRQKEEEHRHRMAAEKDAEKFKTKGNALMANREYEQALEAYSQAIFLSPSGPQSHVYYSNRAAALCYLERYEEAEKDSIKSLSFDPTYGKAHARLGLSRFFLQNYSGAVEAYTNALKYDPANTASKSYLAKAQAKLDQSAAATARRLMEDENMRALTTKAMADPSKNLLDDPEMQVLSRKAMALMKK